MKKARYAVLVDHFKLTPRDIATLTDRQIEDLYFHKRTKDGSIAVPEVAGPNDEIHGADEGTLESDLRDLDVVAGLLRMRPEQIAEARQRLYAKHAQKEGADGQHN